MDSIRVSEVAIFLKYKRHQFWSKINFLLFVSDPTKGHFYVYSTFYKNLNQKFGPTSDILDFE